MTDKARILVLGDAMLDTYMYGEVSRVSPEAPIPVLCPGREEDRPGGAANVACNAASLGAYVTALFVLGTDRQAERLKDILYRAGVNVAQVCQNTGQDTINKVRLVGNRQQIARIDLHDRYRLDAAMEGELLSRFREELQDQDIVILSDYNKGTCTETVCREVIRLCAGRNTPVIVDPKGVAWDKYRGAYIITPNMKEMNQYCGQSVHNDDKAIEAAFVGMSEKLGIRYLLLTRSERGMSLLGSTDVLHIPTQAQEVNDVSGAGDTVVAALSVRLAEEPEDVEDAVRFANAAAGVAVGKPGTSVVTRQEVLAREAKESRFALTPGVYTITDMGALEATVQSWRDAGETIVTTNGCFDVLHAGHLKVLQEAKRQGDRLIVAVNADAAVRRLKGADRPINGERERANMLLSMRMVDAVVIFDPKKDPCVLSESERERLTPQALSACPEAPMALLRRIRPDVHVKGGDYKPTDLPEALFAGRVVLVSYMKGHSTTGILERMKG